LALRRVMEDLAGQHVFVRRHVLGGLPLRATQPRRLDATERGSMRSTR
jgi:hypothetical protein